MVPTRQAVNYTIDTFLLLFCLSPHILLLHTIIIMIFLLQLLLVVQKTDPTQILTLTLILTIMIFMHKPRLSSLFSISPQGTLPYMFWMLPGLYAPGLN